MNAGLFFPLLQAAATTARNVGTNTAMTGVMTREHAAGDILIERHRHLSTGGIK